MALDPLIITSNDPMVPDGPDQVEQTIEEGVAAWEAGAAILHHHCIFRPQIPGTAPELDVEKSVQVLSELRRRTDAILQLGITVATNESRMAVAKIAPVDQMSITLCDNDHFISRWPNTHRDREEMVMLADFCLARGIQPEFEVFHAGAAWNLHYLIKKGHAKPPYWINLTLYPEGSCWSPKIPSEIDHRASLLPEGSRWHLVAFAREENESIMPIPTPEEHTQLLTYATLKGGNVRTGKEDRPYLTSAVLAESNAELVRLAADMSQRLGRSVATPAEARRLLSLPPA